MGNRDRFQFPSSGKLLPNVLSSSDTHRIITFQFPSSGKLLPNATSASSEGGLPSFNSLQAGNSYQTRHPPAPKVGSQVSIPFKRETPTKLAICVINIKSSLSKFQFPSSGKLLPNTHIDSIASSTIEFQFPSSGKLLPNWRGDFLMNPRKVSIPFKRETPTKHNSSSINNFRFQPGFNSLQAGNSYQTKSPHGCGEVN